MTSTTATPTPTNDKNLEVNLGYGDTDMPNKKTGTTCELNEDDILQVVKTLASTTKVNRTLKVVVVCLCVFAVLLAGSVFGATITAARLTKQTEIDSITGIMYSKESNNDHSHQTTMKTEDVVIYSDTTKIIDMTNEELKALKEISLGDGGVKFQIKGYARGKDRTQIGLLVEGGTIIYDMEGLASATGDAKILLDLAYGLQEDAQENGGERRRYLSSTCSMNCTDASRRFLSSSSASSSASTSCTQVGSGTGTGSSNHGRSF